MARWFGDNLHPSHGAPRGQSWTSGAPNRPQQSGSLVDETLDATSADVHRRRLLQILSPEGAVALGCRGVLGHRPSHQGWRRRERNDGGQGSACLLAASKGAPDTLGATLAADADVNDEDSWSGTALICAADRGQPWTFGRLLRAGVDLDHVNRIGYQARPGPDAAPSGRSCRTGSTSSGSWSAGCRPRRRRQPPRHPVAGHGVTGNVPAREALQSSRLEESHGVRAHVRGIPTGFALMHAGIVIAAEAHVLGAMADVLTVIGIHVRCMGRCGDEQHRSGAHQRHQNSGKD